MFRGSELDEYSFLDFLLDTYDEPKKAVQHTHDTSTTVIEDTWNGDEDQVVTASGKRGRPRNRRIPYQIEHSKHELKVRVLRSAGHNKHPSIIGPHLPRSDDIDHNEFYCAVMLALLKPWRNLNELKNLETTWSEALNDLTTTGGPVIARILANIQFYYESRSKAKGCKDGGGPYDGFKDAACEEDNGFGGCEKAQTEIVGTESGHGNNLTHRHAVNGRFNGGKPDCVCTVVIAFSGGETRNERGHHCKVCGDI